MYRPSRAHSLFTASLAPRPLPLIAMMLDSRTRLRSPRRLSKPRTNYTYGVAVNSSSDVYQFPTTIGQAPSSEGFGANVTAVLYINAEALSQSPDPDSLVFSVAKSVSSCNIQKGPAVLD